MATHRIAVMPGDGIGKEVVPEGLRVLEKAAQRFDIGFEFRHFDWSCDYYAKHGRMMPEDWFATLSGRSRRSSTARWAGPRRCPTTCRCGAR
jgi:tartrate dehydrogenase/decarboxylase/D-malate dehydrogenase